MLSSPLVFRISVIMQSFELVLKPKETRLITPGFNPGTSESTIHFAIRQNT